MSQTYLGEVQNGVIVLEAGSPVLPDGMKVRVRPTEMKAALGDLSAQLRSIRGAADDLPEDLAENHDHYLHGTRKRP